MDISVAKVTSQGQITIPADVRRALGIQAGDKVMFARDGDKIVVMNASMEAWRDMQRAFDGEAARLGLKDEQDVVDLVKQVRAKMKKEAEDANHG